MSASSLKPERKAVIPIRIKQFPQFVRQAIKRSWILSKPDPGTRTFHLCFFSCHSYFSYLYCSLHSLVRNTSGLSFKVLVFNDDEQPLSQAQVESIQRLIPGTQVIPWPKSMGWGATQISWIWRAYGRAAQDATDQDIIARIDSDVFFFNDTIFQAVARSEADLIGDGHFVDFNYAQGGCYFFRASAVRKINTMIEAETLEKLLDEVDVVVEDVAAYHFAKRLGLKIWLTWFMMFPDELRNAGGLTAWSRWKFSCAHFVMKNKTAMLEAYEKEVLGGECPRAYQLAIKTT
ncbi:MAG: hypothetical protein ACXU7D_03545 [Burkholderiaceae bacterium]